MRYLIGTDEAGYGPNLGPLVVAATVWELPDDLGADVAGPGANSDAVDVCLYKLLKRGICRLPSRSATGARRLPINDSKLLYSTDRGIGQLEHGVLAALSTLVATPTTWHEAFQALCPGECDEYDPAPWHADYEAALPLSAAMDEITVAAARLQKEFARSGVRLLALRGRAIFPEQYNQLIEKYENKSDALSAVTLELLSETMAPLAGGRGSVMCDKHGGRNHYAGLLQHYFPERLVRVEREGREESRYAFGSAGQQTTICFRCKGDKWAPTALASMTAKYLRELAMRAFNDYWNRHLPELRPTAGYSRDAHRFRSDIAEMQTSLGIEDRVLWRSR